jgi:hypothetical protein
MKILKPNRFFSFSMTKRGENVPSEFIKYTLAASAIALLISGCVAAPDRATVSSVSTETHYPNISVRKGKAPAFQKTTKETLPVKVANYNFIGRAPYICTPSGFGRTSSCFLRKG